MAIVATRTAGNREDWRVVVHEECYNSLFRREHTLYQTPTGWYEVSRDTTVSADDDFNTWEGYIPTAEALQWLKDIQNGNVLFGCNPDDLVRNPNGSYSCVTFVR